MSFPLKVEEQYLRLVDRLLNKIDKEVMSSVKGEVDYRKDGITDVVRKLRNFLINFEESKVFNKFNKSLSNIIKSTSNTARKTIRNQLKRAKRPDLELPPVSDIHLEGIVQKNVNLIKTVSREYLADINDAVVESIERAGSQKELEDILQSRIKSERNRAKFWASDQLGKAFSDLSKRNQEEAGIEKYIWRTQKDARVRDSHANLEGTTHAWDNPPTLDGRALHPGDDYNCRCWAEPKI